MSRILDEALDAQRRAECELNDRRIAAGEPCDYCGLPRIEPEAEPPVQPRPRRRTRARTTLRRAAMVFLTGVLSGQLVAATVCPVRVKYVPVTFPMKMKEV